MKYELIQGDCLEVMKELHNKGVKFDLILTDPPYGTTACKWDSIIPLNDMWDCIDKLTYPTTPVLLFGTEPFSSQLRLSNINEYKYDWVWYKNTASGFVFAKKQPLRNNENISVFYKKQCKYNPIKEKRDENLASQKRRQYPLKWEGNSEIYSIKQDKSKKLEELSYPKTIKRFNSVPNSKGRLHPSQKPAPLLEYLIKTYTDEGDVVLDFTMGSGSTGIACQNTNRDFIGIELDEEYYNIASDRLKENNIQCKLC